ncbi:hypothetical protein PsorP6_000817 [Peronosclerospora sorghi]|uniref:Uncharacterized protein n=1 Tax=Peronosclerospora sorghi TaxID=230839 RepID=A0ACC0WQY7_9STRA|nr:hypothetical protein PsorP6_000817 [Peronosclerospora sorghi]
MHCRYQVANKLLISAICWQRIMSWDWMMVIVVLQISANGCTEAHITHQIVTCKTKGKIRLKKHYLLEGNEPAFPRLDSVVAASVQKTRALFYKTPRCPFRWLPRE